MKQTGKKNNNLPSNYTKKFVSLEVFFYLNYLCFLIFSLAFLFKVWKWIILFELFCFLELIYFKNVKKEKKCKKIRMQYWQEITGVGIMYNTSKSFETRKN